MQYFEPVDLNTQEKIWQRYGKSINAVNQDVQAIHEWLKTQPHLPQTMTDRQIKSYLIIGRGSVEKTKPKIDMYFTMRTLFPDIFNNTHPMSSRMILAAKFIEVIPLPKLDSDYNRILLLRFKDADSVDFDPYAMFAYIINVVEIRLFEDICHGHTVIFDMMNVKLSYLVKVTPMLIKHMYTIGDKALTTRVIGIHLINAPNFVDQTVLLVKTIVKPKLANRIVVYRDIKTMVNNVDKSILPKEYGGSEKSVGELQALIIKKFEEYKDFFDQRENLKVNEDLRPTKNVNDETLGYYGNFKKLDVD